MHYHDALTFLRLLWKFMIMNQTFYNLVEINRYERDLASRQWWMRDSGMLFFWTEILAKPQGKKNNLNLPSPSLWNGNGMEWERRLLMIYVTIISWTKARLGIDLTRNRKSSSFSWGVKSVFSLRVCKCLTVKMSDYYDILEVPRSATDQDIKKA